jgi:hypothetical protein
MDFEVQRCTRHCADTGKEFKPDEEFFSALIVDQAQIVRKDYCVDAWEGPPDGALGWWKSKMPSDSGRRVSWAPNDIMLDYFEELQQQPEKQDVRYVLTLLMIRRRLLRVEDEETNEDGNRQLKVFCPRREKTYDVVVVEPDAARQQEIQDELAQLLFAKAA